MLPHSHRFISAAILQFSRAVWDTNQACDGVELIYSPGLLEHEAFTEAQPGWQMLVEGASLIGSPQLSERRSSNSVNTGGEAAFDVSGVLASELNPMLLLQGVHWCCSPLVTVAILLSQQQLRCSCRLPGESGRRGGTDMDLRRQQSSWESCCSLLLAGRGLEPSKAQTERAAGRQNISLYLSFSLVCG